MTKGIYKRGKIYWLRYAGPDGKIVQESARTANFKDAETKLIQKKQDVNDIREGKAPRSEIKRISDHTFQDLVTEYLKFTERQRGYRQKANIIKHLLSSFGILPLRRFNTMLIEQYQTDRLKSGNKPATINRGVATLKHMFTKAVDWNMTGDETLKAIRKVKLLEENNRRLRYLSKEECQALLSSCASHLKPIVITALNTGMRKSEILSLKWENVDLKHGFILLEITKNGERREIPINSTLRDALQAITRRLDIPYVFYDPTSRKHTQDMKRSFNTALRKAGIKDFRFHDLRHTFASHLVMAGVDITTVSRLLGHKSLTMTLRYSHLAPSHMVRALEVLDSTLNERSGVQKLYISAHKEEKREVTIDG